MAKPSSVAERVIQPCQTRLRLESIGLSTVVSQISRATWCGAGRTGRS